ncbi:Glycogen phosphorylase [Lutibaculum baratangense AMV1]|uniref:Glycogen phosphorylase n=1 Tax=Lutibaculum baratangense AMV1 TaxID=631454 RepID=V4RF19_9HYPH|nr:Glycogen phosphorylase [Lutibaculum baratangense AMV1]
MLDGWWIEACFEGVTGWGIGGSAASRRTTTPKEIYDKLERTILPLFYDDPSGWPAMMKQSIGTGAYYFKSQRPR